MYYNYCKKLELKSTITTYKDEPITAQFKPKVIGVIVQIFQQLHKSGIFLSFWLFQQILKRVIEI